MSSFPWQGPAYRLDLACDRAVLRRRRGWLGLPAPTQPLAVALLDGPGVEAQMNALARRARGPVLVVLPEAEVWRGRLLLAAGAPAAAAPEALAPELGPEPLAITIGKAAEGKPVPVAAVRCSTLAQTRDFLGRFGIAVGAITGAGVFPGFAAPPHLDAQAQAARPAPALWRPRLALGAAAVAFGFSVSIGVAALLEPAAVPAAPPAVSAVRASPVAAVAIPEAAALRPMPAPVPRPQRPLAESGPAAASAAPRLPAPGVAGTPEMPRLVARAARNAPPRSASEMAVPAPEPAPPRLLATLPRASSTPAAALRIAASDGLRPLRRAVSPSVAPPPSAAAAPADTPPAGRPKARPPAGAALSEAIGRAVAAAAAESTAAPIPVAAVPVPAPRRAPPRAQAAAKAPVRVQAAAPVRIQPAPVSVQPAPVRTTQRTATAAPQASRQAAAPVVAQRAGPAPRGVWLVGIFGTPQDRHALIRLPNTRVERVAPGARVQGMTVAAVTRDGVLLRGRSGDVVLRLPE